MLTPQLSATGQQQLQQFIAGRDQMAKLGSQFHAIKGPSGQVYLIDRQQKLGEGSFGVVYLAYTVNQDGSVDTNRKAAVKRLKERPNLTEIQKEKAAMADYYWSEDPTVINGQCYLISEYIPGADVTQELFDQDKEFIGEKEHEALGDLTLAQRTRTVVRNLLWYNRMHYETPSTPAMLHRDIKPQNTRLDAGQLKHEPLSLFLLILVWLIKCLAKNIQQVQVSMLVLWAHQISFQKRL